MRLLRSHVSPVAECDLVLKGGVTSGVVYPPAILNLSRRYRFRGIGGTSAGAIAAAATAAAEVGRQQGALTGSGNGGFPRLEQMQEELARPGFLFGLFQPRSEAAGLFRALLGVKDLFNRGHRSRGRTILGVLRVAYRAAPGYAALGAILGLLVAILLTHAFWSTAGELLLPPRDRLRITEAWVLYGVAVLGVLLGAGLGVVLAPALRLLRSLDGLNDRDRAGFGLCSGSGGDSADLTRSEGLALTDWLHRSLQELAGRPLSEAITLRDVETLGGVTFKLVTSNLSVGQPYILPLERGSRSFLFDVEDMWQLFPRAVVDALVSWATRPENVSASYQLPSGLHRFPMGKDLPLVVGTRLSLSFPVLLRAVRVFSVQPECFARINAMRAREAMFVPPMLTRADLEEHWLSDGGIASNFPIHIFDSWVPVRPTFGITLYDSPLRTVLNQVAGAEAGGHASVEKSVVLPLPRDFDLARPRHIRIQSTFQFLSAVFDTAQNFRDNAQSALPSYRERIAQVFLTPDEGGLNFNMPAHVVDRIRRKGKRAAALLVRHFGKGLDTSFDEHLWVRLYVLMAELERELEKVRVSVGPGWRPRLGHRLDALFSHQLATRVAGRGWYRSQGPDWCTEARRRLDQVLELAASWEAPADGRFQPGGRIFSREPPRPEGLLRVTPNV